MVATQAKIDASHSGHPPVACSILDDFCICSVLTCCNWRRTPVVSLCQALMDRSKPPWPLSPVTPLPSRLSHGSIFFLCMKDCTLSALTMCSSADKNKNSYALIWLLLWYKTWLYLTMIVLKSEKFLPMSRRCPTPIQLANTEKDD